MKPFDLELAGASYKLVTEKTLLGLRPGEHLLICADTETDESVVEAVARASHLLGGKVAVIYYASPPDVGEKAIVPKPVEAAMSNPEEPAVCLAGIGTSAILRTKTRTGLTASVDRTRTTGPGSAQ